MNHQDSRIGWIKRRARRIERFYKVSRRLAIYDAWMDWIDRSGLRGELNSAMPKAMQRG